MPPLEARIVRIADAFDTMTHARPYKPAHAIEWALEELARCAGTQFDPELARLFIDQVRNDVGLRDRLVAHRAAHGSLDLAISQSDLAVQARASVSMVGAQDLCHGGVAALDAILDAIRGARSSRARSGGSS